MNEPMRYDVGGGWGDAIDWFHFKDHRVVGWKSRIPEVGDYLFSKMESGRTGVFRFAEVKRCGDPPDMFFATMDAVGYEDKLELPKLGRPTSVFLR